ncbi:MAG: TIGR00730 family Rossman fold protein [Candidatus Jorgensenbacteria bacterium]|nr:TIGR00730 family Rossman fold protein [Candidatus Jorgensenbacteria bacterium]
MKKENTPAIGVQSINLSDFETQTKLRVFLIAKEFAEGFKLISAHKLSVTFFGSTRFAEDNKYYIQARRVAGALVKIGYTVVTGGGPGIMEAANRGAKEAGGASIGFSIQLPNEQSVNPYVTENVSFHHFFSRKVILSFSAESYVYFPGGIGTLDEFFEIITLIQTKKIPHVPVILVGTEYWKPIISFMRANLLKKFKTIDAKDLELFTVTDSDAEIIKIVRSAPKRKE